ncbi:MAG: iron-containing alcohol dehydrogenase [Clostridia bacterium]|nr:iron-containing alcohol dehydrogenase [Clostridia bacterium]
MINFQYYAPTKVVFGKGTEKQAGILAKEFGATRVLIHYGTGSVVKSGLLDAVKSSLDNEGLPYELFGGAKPNPRLSLVREGIALSRATGVDFVLAVGGGSVIDSAKAIALGIRNDFDVWDLFIGKETAAACAPVAVILTLSAAGSEMSNGTVITNEDGWYKRAYGSDLCRPKFSILNPELTYTVSPYQTSCGAVDIIMHTMERYFTTEPPMDITDAAAHAVIKTIMKNVMTVLYNPRDYKGRAEIMWTGSLSHNGLTGCGGIGDWSTHDIEHELGGIFDIAHGAGLSAIWGSWARYVYKTKPGRFAEFASGIFGIKKSNQELAALAGIEAMENFFEKIGMPVSVSGLGINMTDGQIDEMAAKATSNDTRTLGNFRKLHKEDIKSILKTAR